MSVKLHYLFSVLILFLVCSELERTSAQKSKKKTTVTKEKPVKGPQNYTVFQKKLVIEDNHSVKSIILNHQAFFRETDEYRFDSYVLGYVTPYNNHGYDIAKIFGNKFTHISPMWLNLNRVGYKKSLKITGTHDIDEEWIAVVKNAGRERKLKIVPRLLFERWTGADYERLLSSQEEIDTLIEMLRKLAVKHKFNGYVLEFWSQLAPANVFMPMINFVQYVGEYFMHYNLQLILAIPPTLSEPLFTKEHFDQLYDYVTAFSMRTYDFTDPYREAGPNAPIKWIEESIVSLTKDKKKRKKILAGLNFYGYDYGPNSSEPILGPKFVELLEKHGGLMIYEPNVAEHTYDYMDQKREFHVVVYPTLGSINRRLELLETLRTGVAIWELGQGLDYFYDLL